MYMPHSLDTHIRSNSIRLAILFVCTCPGHAQAARRRRTAAVAAWPATRDLPQTNQFSRGNHRPMAATIRRRMIKSRLPPPHAIRYLPSSLYPSFQLKILHLSTNSTRLSFPQIPSKKVCADARREKSPPIRFRCAWEPKYIPGHENVEQQSQINLKDPQAARVQPIPHQLLRAQMCLLREQWVTVSRECLRPPSPEGRPERPGRSVK